MLAAANQTTPDLESTDMRAPGENVRLKSILMRHVNAKGQERAALRDVLVKYLRFSPQATDLTHDLIERCIEIPLPSRLDIAIDVLSQLQRSIYNYAHQFLINDLGNWSHLYSKRAYEPNDDYWYILLRSVAQADIENGLKLRFISMCSDATSRGVLEGVVEALADVGTSEAKDRLELLREHKDPFLSSLATDALDQEWIVSHRE